MLNTEKKYYKIGEVSEILNIPITTLRYWEKEFTIIKPKRTQGGNRLYTRDDMEKIKMVWYLVKERGMKLLAAEQAIRQNRRNVSKRHEVIERLQTIKSDLQILADTFEKISRESHS